MSSIIKLPQWLLASLKDPAKAAAYLNEALKLGDREVFIEAIRDVFDAQNESPQSIVTVELDNFLGGNGEIMTDNISPELDGVFELLDALGFRIVIAEKKDHLSQSSKKCMLH